MGQAVESLDPLNNFTYYWLLIPCAHWLYRTIELYHVRYRENIVWFLRYSKKWIKNFAEGGDADLLA